MKKILFVMAIILLPSCALSPTRVGTALVSDVQEPENTARFVTKYNSYTKTGKSCATNYLGILAVGDMTVETAKKNGKISQISSISQDKKNFVVVSTVCTIVNGK